MGWVGEKDRQSGRQSDKETDRGVRRVVEPLTPLVSDHDRTAGM